MHSPQSHRVDTERAARRSRTSLIGGYSVLLATFVSSQLLGLAGLALVSREVGPSGLGDFGYATTVAAYFALPLLPGFALLGTRRLATAEPHDRPRIVFELQLLAVVNAVFALVLLTVGASLLTPTARAGELLPILGLSVVVNAAGVEWALQGLQQVRRIGVIRLVGQVAYLAVVLVLWQSDRLSVFGYAWANVLGLGLTAALDGWFVWRTIGRPAFRGHLRVFGERRAVRRILRATLPLAVSAVMLQIYLYSAVIILGQLASASDVGQYTTAARLPIAMLFLSTLWGTVFYPHAAQLRLRDPDLLLTQVGHFSALAAFLIAPAVPIAFFIGSDVLGTLFGGSFRPGGLTFALLIGYSALALVTVNVTNLMLAANDDRGFVIRVSLAALVSVGLGLVLVPVAGPEGAAAATLVAEAVTLALALARVTKVIGPIPPPDPRRVLSAVLALGATVAVLVALTGAPWVVSTIAAGATYYLIATALGAIRPGHLRTPA